LRSCWGRRRRRNRRSRSLRGGSILSRGGGRREAGGWGQRINLPTSWRAPSSLFVGIYHRGHRGEAQSEEWRIVAFVAEGRRLIYPVGAIGGWFGEDEQPLLWEGMLARAVLVGPFRVADLKFGHYIG